MTDYPFTSPGSVREFIAFVFEDAGFERVPGDHEPYQKYQDLFQSSGPGAFVIQSIRQESEEAGRQRVELWLGPNFGGIVVTYAGLRAYTRGSTAEQTGPMTWQYRDSRTNDPFEFAYPFPTLAPPVREEA